MHIKSYHKCMVFYEELMKMMIYDKVYVKNSLFKFGSAKSVQMLH